MKRIVLIITLLAALNPSYSIAGWNPRLYDTEDVLPVASLGVKGGMQIQYLAGNTPYNETYKNGPLAGLFFDVHRKMIGGRIEANIRQIRYRNNQTGVQAAITNFDVPVLFEFRPIRELKIHLGAQFTAFPVVQDRSKDIRRYFASQEVSGVFGVEGDLPWNFTAGLKLIKGFSDINDYNSKLGKWHTTSMQFYVGYRIIHGGY